MGYLKQVEPIFDASRPIYTFSRKVPGGERGYELRDGSFAIGAIDFGSSPFGDNGAPRAIWEWTWKGRILTLGKPDRAYDALVTACGEGKPVRLVWIHDDGWERVVRARMKKIAWPRAADDSIFVDAEVTWVINQYWHERGFANQIVAGLGTPIVANAIGGADDVVAGQQSFPILGGGGTSTYIFPTTTNPIADASVAGAGGTPNQDDTTPIILISGPMGGDFGFILYNYAATVIDRSGNTVNPQIGETLFVPPGATCRIDCGAQKITMDGFGDITDKKYKLDVQPYWFIVKSLVNNGLGIASNGLNGINYYQPVSILPDSLGNYPSTGTFQLRVTPPGQTVQTTGFLAFNSTPAQVQAALEPMGGLGVGQVRVTAFQYNGIWYNANGQAGYNVMFIGSQAGVTIPTMASVNTFNRGSVSIATINGSLTVQWMRKFRGA